MSQVTNPKPRVLIVGAGMGGITLGILLGKIGIDYHIFERAAVVKPLGSAISLGANILPMMEQIGLLDQFLALGKPMLYTNMCNEKRELDYRIDTSFLEEKGGYHGYVVPRAAVYDLLLQQIPPERIHFRKRVLKTSQTDEKITIHTSDNGSYEGDILVGADGAYSSVRQNMFNVLRDAGRLPKGDDVDLPFSCICLVGKTRELDVKEFPELALEEAIFQCVIGEQKPYSWATFTTHGNSICWMVIHHLDEVSSKTNDAFRNSEWGPEAAEAMAKEVRHFPIPGGVKGRDLVLGDLFDQSDLISKAMLEEKVFDTWYSGRTVLLGDACHKMNPAAGQGAISAMQDALTLANWINILPSSSPTGPSTAACEKIFFEYRSERYPIALQAFSASRMMSQLVAQDLKGKMARYLSKRMPPWLQRMALTRMAAVRPQVSFLPPAKDNGSIKPVYQASYEKTKRILERRAAAAAAAAAV